MLKGLAHADLAKKRVSFCCCCCFHDFLLFHVRLLYSINFCFGPFEMRQFKNNCSGPKIDCGSPPAAAIYGMRITSLHFVVLHKFFVDSAFKQ